MSMNLKYDINWGGESYSVTDILPRDYEGTVVIPETHEGLPVTRIGGRAFCKSKITSVVIPASVRTIDHQAFKGCEHLENVTFAENSELWKIGNAVFEGCTGLKDLYLPDGLMYVGYCAFENCHNLHCVLPDTCGIEINTFKGCKKHSTYVSNRPPFRDENGFEFCLNREKNGYVCTKVGRYGFHLVVPESFNGLPVTELEERLFDSLEFAFVHIPATVTKAGDFIFYGCDDACGAYYGGTMEAWKKMDIYTWFSVDCADGVIDNW